MDRLESRAPRAENKPVTAGTFIDFRGPQALKDRVESRGSDAENKLVTARTFMRFRGPQALKDMDEFLLGGVFADDACSILR